MTLRTGKFFLPVRSTQKGKTMATMAPAPIAFNGQRLRILRITADLNQAELATKAGLSTSGVRGLEAGRYDPSMSVLCRLVAALGCEISELFTDTRARSDIKINDILEDAS